MNSGALRSLSLVAAASLVLGFAETASAQEASTLTKNPFKRPILSAPQANADAVTDGGALPAPQWEIRAILVAGGDSLVNIAGEIIRLGEIHEGLELISVDESKAVFRRDGERITIRLYEDENVTDGP